MKTGKRNSPFRLQVFITIIFAALVISGPWLALGKEKKPLKIQWFGQACFLVEWPEGTSVLIDPFNEKIGYDMPSPRPDVVLITHEHFDHNNVGMAQGKPQVIRGLTESGDWSNVSTFVKGIVVRTVGTYHDDGFGSRRGKNAVFIMEGKDYKIAHMGDIGHKLGPELVEKIGKVDVLMVPVGGTYTVDAEAAQEIADRLSAKVILPMHYKTDRVTIPIETVDPFLKGKTNVKRIKGNTLLLKGLPDKPEIYVMDYK